MYNVHVFVSVFSMPFSLIVLDSFIHIFDYYSNLNDENCYL